MADPLSSSEALSGQNRTSSTPAVALAHTVLNPSGQSFIVFFSCEITVNNVNTRCKVDLYVDGSLVASFSPRQNATHENHNVFFFQQVTGKSSNFDCEIKWSSTNNSNTASISNARIVAWRYDHIDGLDLRYAEGNASSTGLTSSFADGASVSWEPGTTGNYFMLGCSGIAPGSTSSSAVAKLLFESSSIPYVTNTNSHWAREAPSAVTDAFYSFFTGTRQSVETGSSKTLKVQARNTSGTTGSWQYSRVLAFREDAFASSNFDEDNTASEQTTTSGSFQGVSSVTTSTPGASSDYLVLAGLMLTDSGDNAEIEYCQTECAIDSTQLIKSNIWPKQRGTNSDYLSSGVAAHYTSAASFSADTRFRRTGSDTWDNTARTKNSWLMVLLVPEGETITGKTGMDTLSLSISDASTLQVLVAVADTLSISVTEASTLLGFLSRTDTLSISLDDIASILAILNTSTDTLTLSIDDVATLLTTLQGSDILSLSTTESNALQAVLGGVDSLSLATTEGTPTLDVSLTRSDTLTISLSEVVLLKAIFAVADSLDLSVLDASTVVVTLTGADSTAIGITDAMTTLLVALNGTDSLDISFTEAVTILAFLSRTDTLSLSIDEQAALLVSLDRADTLGLQVDESPGVVLALLQASDIIGISIQELVTLLVSLMRTDTLGLTFTESVALFVSLSRSDTLALSLSESVNTLVQLRRDDVLSLALTEQVALASTSLASDSLGIALGESSTITAILQSIDTVSLSLADATTISVVTSGADSLQIQFSELALLNVLIGVSDSLGISLADAATLVKTWEGILQPAGIQQITLKTHAVATLEQSQTTIVIDTPRLVELIIESIQRIQPKSTHVIRRKQTVELT